MTDLPGGRVFVHVGAPKTGTSFVQDLLFLQRDELAEAGILYPADRFDSHFLAALDLMELPWGGLESQARGRFAALADEVRQWPGTAIVSHEILARASAEQAARALQAFGHGSGKEVHLVYSARDLVRQIPAEWQENVKHRRTLTYAEFTAQIRDPRRPTELAAWFWGVQELPDVLTRWGSTLPAEHVHLVTVPQSGAPADLLYQRFGAAFGLEERWLKAASTRSNPSLGVPETRFIRELNAAVNGTVVGDHYREYVRELLAHRTLSQRRESARLGVTPDTFGWARDLSQRWIDWVATQGFSLHGDLEDLIPVATSTAFVDPDTTEVGAEVAVAASAALVARLGDFHDEVAHLREEVARAYAARDAAESARFSVRLRRRVLASLERHPRARRAFDPALRAYRTARGR